MGFMDVLDANGNVIYPAEAFLYGGRPSIAIPNDLPQYLDEAEQPGIPDRPQLQLRHAVRPGLHVQRQLHVGGLHRAAVPGRSAGSHDRSNAGIRKKFRNWDFKFDATNLTNEHAYRPRQYNGSAGQLITAMPLARYNLTARFNFK